MDKMGGTRQPREIAEKRDKFFWLSSRVAYISDSASTVWCPGFDPQEHADFTQPSRPSNLMYISTGERLKKCSKIWALSVVNYWLLTSSIST